MVVIDKKKNMLTTKCIYCSKKVRNPLRAFKSILGQDIYCYTAHTYKCTLCGFVSSLNKTFDSLGKIYFKSDRLTIETASKIKTANRFSDFRYTDFNNRPYSRYVEFIAKKFITDNSVALLNTRNKNEYISNYCWNYLKTRGKNGNV